MITIIIKQSSTHLKSSLTGQATFPNKVETKQKEIISSENTKKPQIGKEWLKNMKDLKLLTTILTTSLILTETEEDQQKNSKFMVSFNF